MKLQDWIGKEIIFQDSNYPLMRGIITKITVELVEENKKYYQFMIKQTHGFEYACEEDGILTVGSIEGFITIDDEIQVGVYIDWFIGLWKNWENTDIPVYQKMVEKIR